jgi:hypothetical protein
VKIRRLERNPKLNQPLLLKQRRQVKNFLLTTLFLLYFAKTTMLGGKSFEDPGAVIKRNAINAVTGNIKNNKSCCFVKKVFFKKILLFWAHLEKLRRELKSTYDRMASEIDELMSAGSTDPRT